MVKPGQRKLRKARSVANSLGHEGFVRVASENEFVKKALIFKGNKASGKCQEVLRALHQMRHPHTVYWTGKNNSDVNFSSLQSLGFLCSRNDCGLFAMGTHQKKRPNCISLGRCFNNEVLDMAELEIVKHEPMDPKKGGQRIGTKPMVVFLGTEFSANTSLQRMKNLLLDWFRGPDFNSLNLSGLDHLIAFTVIPPEESKDDGSMFSSATGFRLKMDSYGVKVNYDKEASAEGSNKAQTSLTKIGPNIEFKVHRTQFADNKSFQTACFKPAAEVAKPQKNISKAITWDTTGQLHVKNDGIEKMASRNFKATEAQRARTKREKRAKKLAAAAADLQPAGSE